MTDSTVRVDLTAYVGDRSYSVQLEAPAVTTDARRQVVQMADAANSHIANLMESYRA